MEGTGLGRPDGTPKPLAQEVLRHLPRVREELFMPARSLRKLTGLEGRRRVRRIRLPGCLRSMLGKLALRSPLPTMLQRQMRLVHDVWIDGSRGPRLRLQWTVKVIGAAKSGLRLWYPGELGKLHVQGFHGERRIENGVRRNETPTLRENVGRTNLRRDQGLPGWTGRGHGRHRP